MKGLMVKDFLQLKKEFNFFYLILMILPTLSGLANPTFFLPIFSILMGLYWGTFVLTGLGKDESCNWIVTTLSFPLTIKQLVLAKYLFAFALSVCSMLSVFIVGVAASSFIQFNINYISLYALIAGIFSICFCLLVIPIAYRFGANSCRYFVFAFAGLPGVVAMIANYFEIDYLSYATKINLSKFEFWSLVILIASVIIFISIYLSFKSYRKP